MPKTAASPRTIETWRDKIAVGRIITRLQGHIDGKVEMTATQVRAAEVLLKRVMPEVTSTSVTHNHSHIVRHIDITPVRVEAVVKEPPALIDAKANSVTLDAIPAEASALFTKAQTTV